jgi:hypothetical protein
LEHGMGGIHQASPIKNEAVSKQKLSQPLSCKVEKSKYLFFFQIFESQKLDLFF